MAAKRRNVPMVICSTLVAAVTGGTFLYLVDFPAAWKTALFFILITFSGCWWGLLCGVGHGLPIEPRLVLTSLRVPAVILRYEHHSHFSFSGVGPRRCRHTTRRR